MTAGELVPLNLALVNMLPISTAFSTFFYVSAARHEDVHEETVIRVPSNRSIRYKVLFSIAITSLSDLFGGRERNLKKCRFLRIRLHA